MAGRVYRSARIMSLRDWVKAVAIGVPLALLALIALAVIVLS